MLWNMQGIVNNIWLLGPGFLHICQLFSRTVGRLVGCIIVVPPEEVSIPWQVLWKNRCNKVWGTMGHTNPPEEQLFSTLEGKAFEYKDAE